MANNKNTVNPLTWNVPIVNKDGTPTDEFMRKWAQQASTNASIPNLTSAAAVSAFLDLIGLAQGDILYRDTTQWKVLAPGTLGYILKTGGAAANPAWESVSAALDSVGSTQGNVLYRGASAWQVLAPGTDGYLLQYNGTTHAPQWSNVAGVLLGSGAPASLQPAGTLYSRTDAAGVYSSQPINTALSVVQFASTSGASSAIDSPTLPGAPTVGNLLIAFLGTNSDPSSHLSGNWTSFANGGATRFGRALYRYVQVGDVAHLPAIGSGGGFFWFAEAYEISGVSGTWATDFEQFKAAYDQTPGSITTTAATTTSVNTLALLGSGDYNSSTATDYSALSAGWTPADIAAHNTANYGAWLGAHQAFPSSGATVQATFTTPVTGADKAFYVVAIFNPSGSLSANWVKVGPFDPTTAFGFTQGSIPFTNAGGGLSQDNANFFWDETNKRFSIGYNVPDVPFYVTTGNTPPPATAVTAGTLMHLVAPVGGNELFFGDVAGASNTHSYTFRTSEGTYVAPTAISNTHVLYTTICQGYDGGAFRSAARYRFVATENWGAGTNFGCRFDLLLTPNGSATTASKFVVQGDGRYQFLGALCDQSYSRQVPLTGFTITPANTVERLILNPAGLLATGTITAPAAPLDGQVFKIASSQQVTALTVQANAGQTMSGGYAAALFAANSFAEWTYVLADTNWYRTG